jgi:hypothetical protein
MAVLQHYYTSFSNPSTGSVGFQCKAMSPGITLEDQKTLNSLIGYRIPPSLADRPISDHPAALRYIYLSPEKCMLVCSQSNGTDENGRPGNFFSHSVITTPKDFDVFPPIMYWKHPFWRIRDDSPEQVIPPMPAFDQNPSLEFQQIWPFLEIGERRKWYYKILCAVLQYDQAKRPIIILDSVDNIALWILAVTVSLPQIYRHFISFATYHHDPYAGLFLITGTTTDSKFRFSPDEYISYFVLNTEQNRISEIPDSIYARYVSEHFVPDQYEEKLLDLFHICNERLRSSRPANMNATLSAVTSFYQTIRDKSLSLTSPLAQESLRGFIGYIQNRKSLSDEELEDLITTADLLGQQVVKSPELATVRDYGNALRLLKIFHPSYITHAQEDIQFLTHLVLKGKEEIVKSLLSTFNDIYPSEIIRQTLSQHDYLSNLGAEAALMPLEIQNLIWKYLIPFVHFDTGTKPALNSLLEIALHVCQNYGNQSQIVPLPEVDQFLTTLTNANREQRRSMLEISLTMRTDDIGQAQRWFYYKLIENIQLGERATYRVIEKSLEPDIELYEIRRDIQRRGQTQIIQTLVDWIDHKAGDLPQIISIISTGLDTSWSFLPEGQRGKLAEAILSNPKIMAYLDNLWINKLVSTYFPNRNFQILGQVSLKLYEENYSHPGLTPDQRAIIGGSLAMTTGRFYEKATSDIQLYLSKVDSATYEAEAKKLIERFFKQGIRLETHIDLLHSTYVRKYESAFWDLYWPNFKLLMFDLNRSIEFINLLSFWFNNSMQVFSDTPYIGQSFFLELPMVLEEARNDKSFSRVAGLINERASNQPWYSLIDQFFTGKKKRRLLGFLGKK